MTVNKEEIVQTMDVAEWGWLRAHLERGGLITVGNSLDLGEVAYRVALDDGAAVQGWIESGAIGRPTAEQIAAWDAEPGKKFRMIIVSPYVLIQEVPL